MDVESSLERRDFSRERQVIVCNSREEAISLVKDFWRVIALGRDISLPDDRDEEGWCEELTAGDRTRIARGTFQHQGKWTVFIMGNHQPLSSQALEWLAQNVHHET